MDMPAAAQAGQAKGGFPGDDGFLQTLYYPTNRQGLETSIQLGQFLQ